MIQMRETVAEKSEKRESKAVLGKPAPDFNAKAVDKGEIVDVKLKDYAGQYVVLFFYPLDFTFVCPTEIIAFSDRADEFKGLGAQLLACSTCSVYSHLAWINQVDKTSLQKKNKEFQPRKQGGLGEMKIPILADKSLKISRDYGVLQEEQGIAYRGLFIIDPKGTLRQVIINDLPIGRSVDEALRLLQAIQFVEKNGEMCPANWNPGKETIKPNAKGAKEYFDKVNN